MTRKLLSIARVTFSEIIRDKVLYTSVFCAILLLGIAFFASKLTFIRPDRILLDFGLAAVSIASTVIAILVGAPMIIREFDRRTVHVALSKPISRFEFIIGKYLGLVMVICANWFLLSAAFLVIYLGSGGTMTGVLAWALVFALLQAALGGAIAVFFSTFSTASLSVMMVWGLYLVGSNLSQLRFIASKIESQAGKLVVEIAATLLPNFEFFNLGTKVTYGLILPYGLVAMTIGYAALMTALYVGLSGLMIYRKER